MVNPQSVEVVESTALGGISQSRLQWIEDEQCNVLISGQCALLPSHVNQSQQCSQAHQVQRIPSERRRSYSDRASQCTSPFCSTFAVSVAVHHPVPQEAVRAVAQLQYGKPSVIPLLCHTVLDPQQ